LNVDDIKTSYLETMAKKYCHLLLRRDRHALIRVISYVKFEILEEEARCQMENVIERAKR
jgi:hypothetical protein